ncbi:MAG: hypothetical protein ACRDKS_16845 [Actinomycetota bacterium]
MRWVILAVLAALLACEGGGGAAPPPDSGIEGLVVIGPTCPVVVQGQDCDDEPYAGEVRVVDRATGKLVATARSGADGRFRIGLAPGDYTLEPVSPNAGGLPFGKPLDVTVRPHTYERVTVSFDSGIR